MDELKSNFIRVEALEKLKNDLKVDSQAVWGKMSAQHMVEHLSRIFLMSIEKENPIGLVISEQDLYKYRRFLLSNRPIKRHVNFPGLPPGALDELKQHTLADAVAELKDRIDQFYLFYDENPDERKLHPYFGNLNGWEWEVFHYKHMIHHLTQFGLLPEDYSIVTTQDISA